LKKTIKQKGKFPLFKKGTSEGIENGAKGLFDGSVFPSTLF
jgi:hypothetical protein